MAVHEGYATIGSNLLLLTLGAKRILSSEIASVINLPHQSNVASLFYLLLCFDLQSRAVVDSPGGWGEGG